MWESITGFFNFSFDLGLIVTMVGVCVAGLAAVVGIWIERDHAKPPRYAYALSGLILLATVVSVAQSYLDQEQSEKLEEDMARMLQQMDKIAANSEDPELQELIKGELQAQQRANPEIVEKLAQRVSDAGGDPTEMLGKHLDAADLEGINRKGLIKKKSTDKTSATKKKKEAKPEPKPVPKAAEEPGKAPPKPIIRKAETKEEKAKAAAAKKAQAIMKGGRGGPGMPGMPGRGGRGGTPSGRGGKAKAPGGRGGGKKAGGKKAGGKKAAGGRKGR